jgi:hypothetical protein
VIAGDICCQKKQTEPILVEGEWSYDDFKTDTFTVMYDREGANGLRDCLTRLVVRMDRV